MAECKQNECIKLAVITITFSTNYIPNLLHHINNTNNGLRNNTISTCKQKVSLAIIALAMK